MTTLDTLLADNGPSHVRVGVVDHDGILRGKYLSTAKLRSILEKGFGFCDVVLGWDSSDVLYDNVRYTGWHTGYPDAPVRVLPDSLCELPGDGGAPFLLCEFAGEAETLCPRGVLRRVLERARRMGYEVCAGFEYEFFVYDETPESARAKHYRDLTPLAPGAFGYSLLRGSEYASVYRSLLDGCAAAGVSLEGLHEETGPGVIEAALAPADGLAAADQAVLFKHSAKTVLFQQGLLATFMAKCSQDWPGQSGHIHVSLRTPDDRAVFHDPDAPAGMAAAMRQFIAGQAGLMPEFLALVAPTINAYTRLVPGYWAPTSPSWGIENRTCALRAIPGSASAQRVEYRVASADANPYLALAAAVASGLQGIEQQADPGEPVTGNAYEQPAAEGRDLPATLWDAAQRLRASDAARDWFGEPFVEHFAASREWEEREFRKHVTDWELARYFEII